MQLKLPPILIIFLIAISPSVLSQETSDPYVLLLKCNCKEEKRKVPEISDSIKKYNNALSLEDAFNSLGEKLISKGYVDLSKELLKKNDSLYIGNLTLGTFYKNIKLEVPKNLLLRELIVNTNLTIKNDSILLETAFAKAQLQNISFYTANAGLPFSELKISNLRKSKGNILVGKLDFETGEKRIIQEIIIDDYKSIRKSILKYRAKLRLNETFNRELLNNQSNKLASLPFITEIKKPEVLFTTDSTKVFFYLSKKNANTFDGLLSFANEVNQTLKLNGYLDLSLINNFNYGESIFIQYRADGNDQSQLRAIANLPYTFNLPIGIESELNLFRKDTTFSNNSLGLRLLYQNLKNTTLSVGFNNISSNNLRANDNDSIASYSKNSITIGSQFQRESNQNLFPIRSQFAFNMGYGKRNSKKKTISQYTFELTANHIFKINDKNQILVNNQTRYLLSSDYLFNELYTLGGINSIRGFQQNSIFANWHTTFSSEYQYLLNSNLFVHTILDASYIENKISNTTDLLTALGIGTGISTKAGLLKLNVSNGSFKNEKFKFSNTMLNINIQTTF